MKLSEVKVLAGKSTATLRFIHPPVYVGEEEGNVEGETDNVGDPEEEGNVDGEIDIVGDSDGNFVSVGAGEIVGSGRQNGTSQYSHFISGSVVKHQARSSPSGYGLRQ
jgi:hypothetical protein